MPSIKEVVPVLASVSARSGAADRRERRLAPEPVDVLAGADQHLAGVAGEDSQQPDGARGGGSDQLLKLVVERSDLLIEGLDSPRERPQRILRGGQRPGGFVGCEPKARTDGGFAT
jgi:hypothetical protein